MLSSRRFGERLGGLRAYTMKSLLARFGLLPSLEQEMEYIGDPADLSQLGRGKTVLLCGQMVFASLTGAHPGRDFIRQFSRRSMSRKLTLRRAPEIHVFAETHVLQEALAKRSRILFALDHYLAWGFSQRGSTILVGGYPSESSTSLQLYIFSNGQLRTIQEKVLPAGDNPRYPSELAFFLEETRANFPGYKCCWAAPLTPLEDEYLRGDIVNIGTQPFARLVQMPVRRSESSGSMWYYLGTPLLIWGALAIVYAGMSLYPYRQYKLLKKEYETRTEPRINPQTCQPNNYPDYLYRSQTNKLEVIEMRRDYMHQPSMQGATAQQLNNRLQQVASIPNLTILEFNMKLEPVQDGAVASPAARGGNDTASLNLSVRVPRLANMTALDQGNALLKELTRRMGTNLHLRPQGWQDAKATVNGRTIETRVYIIEG